MKTQQLPIDGEALAYATKEYVDEAYERVREVLEWTHLPRAILAIWENSPMLKPERKEFPAPIGEIRDIYLDHALHACAEPDSPYSFCG